MADSKDPRQHVEDIERMLHEVAEHLGMDNGRIKEPQALALFEAAREVVNGLLTAFEHYRRASEAAWAAAAARNWS
jgi:hypothetical protein